MTTTHTLIRPGMTALAAVIALSATSAFAQAQPEAAPVTIAPPAPTVEAAPTSTAPAPAAAPMIAITPPAPAEATTTNASAPVESVKTMGTPVVHQPETPVADAAAPVARKAAPMRRAETAAPAAPAAKIATAKSAAATPAVTPAAQPLPRQAAPAPARPAAPVPIKAVDSDESLMIAGAGSLALIAIAGGAFALNRRRRADEEVYDTTDAAYEPDVAATDHAVARPAIVAPVAAASALPDAFDSSRFGRHVQVAYAGPTPENPSMSLRRRLARARFFDQRERMGERFDGAATPEVSIQRRPLARKDGFVTTLLGSRTNIGFRPAYQG